MPKDTPIQHVSDTALWVAAYRARESRRSDALFQDPLADKLVGERGHQIADRMHGTKYTAWSVVIRTYLIDHYIYELLSDGVDTVINLGAGLDTRPYRLDLPSHLQWIEVDYPHMVDYKNQILKDQTPRCHLERFALDLSDQSARQNLFSNIQKKSKNVLVLTEGVTPYLSEEQVASLAVDLKSCDHFRYWITDYFSPRLIYYLRKGRMRKQMKNAPFQFAPLDWEGFFRKQGWKLQKIRFLAETSEELGRAIPAPWFARWLQIFLKNVNPKGSMRRFAAYTILVPADPPPS